MSTVGPGFWQKLKTLETIRNASDASLQSHAEQTILTFRRISDCLHDLSSSFRTTPIDPGSVPSPPHSPRRSQGAKWKTRRGQAVESSPISPQRFQATGFEDYHSFPEEDQSVPSPPHSPRFLQSARSATLGDETDLSSPQTPHVRGLEVPSQGAQSVPATESSSATSEEEVPARPDHITPLLKGVKKSAPRIWGLVQESDLLSRKRNSDEDPRLEHIRRIEGDKALGSRAKLQRVLALRSIALEFTKQQQDNGVSLTKLDALYQETIVSEPSKSSRANVFNIGTKDLAATKDSAATREFHARSLAAGLKYIVFEKIIAAHCHGEENLPNMSAAISAIVGLQIDQFRRFRFDEMRGFAQKLGSDNEIIKLPSQKMRLIDVIRDLSPWFNKLQSDYNLIFQSPVSGMESSREMFPRTDRNILSEESLNEQPPSKRVSLPPLSRDTARIDRTNTAAASTNAELGFNDASTTPIHAELGLSNCPNTEPTNHISSSNFQNLPCNYSSFQDFDPLQDYDILQDFDPLQDWDILQDPNFHIDTEEILKNSENLHVHFKDTMQTEHGHTGQESGSYATLQRDDATIRLSLRHISLPQPVS